MQPHPLPDHPDIVLITAPNPGPLTLAGTNTYVVGTGRAYVIDPGPHLPAHLDRMASWLRDNRRPEGILLTHAHRDHSGGAAHLAELLDVPIHDAAELMGSSPGKFEVDDEELRPIDTPGHTDPHVSIWMPGRRILFSGDLILGEGTSVVAPPEGDMIAYMASLRRVRDLAPVQILPGHGPIISDPDRVIADYIHHREERERQVVAALTQRPGNAGDLVRRIYVGTPADLLPWAEASVEAQLGKLQAEGRVISRNGLYFAVPLGESRR